MVDDLTKDFTDKETGLTEKEQYFLDILFDVHKGNIRKAMDASGFPKSTPTSSITMKLKDKIKVLSEAYLTASTAKAVMAIDGVLDDPTAMGANTILKAAQQVLDRSGVVAPEVGPKEIIKNIIILPAKDSDESDI
jgi:hypothetical protein